MSRIDSPEALLRHVDGDVARGASVYTPATLASYDWFVLGFSNSWAWRCPSSQILDLYNQHVSARHLDIGVGTGYFLDRCRFPSAAPTIALLDLNKNCLATTARRLQRYAPSCHVGNVLQSIEIGMAHFDSIGLNSLRLARKYEGQERCFCERQALIERPRRRFRGNYSWDRPTAQLSGADFRNGTFTTLAEFLAMRRTTARIWRPVCATTLRNAPCGLWGAWRCFLLVNGSQNL